MSNTSGWQSRNAIYFKKGKCKYLDNAVEIKQFSKMITKNYTSNLILNSECTLKIQNDFNSNRLLKK